METPSIEIESILVTGGGGFIGSHLVDALVEDNEMRILDDSSTRPLRPFQ